jgi:nitronate monooxygenase
MGGGFSTPELVAAVCESGGLGSLAAPYLQPQAILDEASAVRRLTSRPFAINLFVFDPPAVDPAAVAEARRRLKPFCEALGVEPPDFAPPAHPDIPSQLDATLEARPAAFSFTFGIPDQDWLARFRRKGIMTIGTATTLAEGLALEAAGVDAVCAQGSEAGAHRGSFLAHWRDSMVGVLPLVDVLSSRLKVPVIAAGGIMTGRGVRAALAAGAQAVQMGTAFLACPEAGTPAPHRRALLSPAAANTAVTEAFSGRAARGIVNRYMNEMAGPPPAPFPILNAMTRGIRAAAARQDRPEFMSLWAGQGAPLIRDLPASDLMRTLAGEMEA